MADEETRKARVAAHDAIDPLWESGKYSRGTLYKKLSKKLGREVHVGSSSIEQCKEIISAIAEL